MGLCNNNCTAWSAYVWGNGSAPDFQPDPDIAGVGVRQSPFCACRKHDPLIVSCLDHYCLRSKQFYHPLLCFGILDPRCLDVSR